MCLLRKKKVIECLLYAQLHAGAGDTIVNAVEKVLMEFAGLRDRTVIKLALIMLSNTC